MITEGARVPKLYIDILDQVFEIEKKLAAIEQSNSISRNINRLKDLMASIYELSLIHISEPTRPY